MAHCCAELAEGVQEVLQLEDAEDAEDAEGSGVDPLAWPRAGKLVSCRSLYFI